jgi:hypothetical protein
MVYNQGIKVDIECGQYKKKVTRSIPIQSTFLKKFEFSLQNALLVCTYYIHRIIKLNIRGHFERWLI